MDSLISYVAHYLTARATGTAAGELGLSGAVLCASVAVVLVARRAAR